MENNTDLNKEISFENIMNKMAYLDNIQNNCGKNFEKCRTVSDAELKKRKEQWIAPDLKVSRGVLYKYAKTVSSASKGCVTDEF